MASGDHVTSGKLLSILRNQRLEMGLSGVQTPQAQTEFFQFLGALLQYVENRWNTDEGWQNGEVTNRDAMGKVKFNELPLGETGTPHDLIFAVSELLKEERDTIAKLFPQANLKDLDTQREELEDAHSSTHAQEALEKYLHAIHPEHETEEEGESEFPATFKNRLESEREAAIEQEEHLESLLLPELGKELQEELTKQQSVKQQELAAGEWSDEQEAFFLSLTQLNEEYKNWVNDLQNQRREIITSRVLERLLIDRDKIGNRYQAVFFEHTNKAGFSKSDLDESAVEKAAEAYWEEIYEIIVRGNKITSPDQTFEKGVFERTVFETYTELTAALQNLSNKSASGSKTLATKIEATLGKGPTAAAPAAGPEGGADDNQTTEEEATGPTPPAEPTEPDWKPRRTDILTRLLNLQRESESSAVQSQNIEILSSVINSLANTAHQYWDVAGDAASLTDIFDAINDFDFEAWATEQIESNHPEVITNAFDTFERLLTAAEQQLQTSEKDVSPGEAAALALAAQEAAETASGAQSPTPEASASPTALTAETALEQLKDLGKLTHAQATLTELTMQILEDELRQNSVFSESQIQSLLQQNREAVSQAVWTNYLQTLTGKVGSGDLTATLMAQIAFSSSGLFLDKFNLETFGTENPLTGTGANRGFSGSLPPGILEKLNQIAIDNGYNSADELVVAMFGQNLSREQALYKFIRLASDAASFNESKIANISRLLIDQQLTPAQRASGNQVELWLAQLDQDQAGFDNFFLQLPQDQLSAEAKRKWLLLRNLLQRAQGRELSRQENLDAEQYLLELSPLLQMYTVYGDSFYALRFGIKELNQFSSAAAEYRQYEEQLALATPAPSVSGLVGPAEYEFVIPEAFGSVTFIRIQTLKPVGRSARAHLPLFLAISGNDLQRQTRVASYIERGNDSLSKRINLVQWQRASGATWSDDMHRIGGGVPGQNMRGMARVAAKAKKGNLLKTLLKNKQVIGALVSTASAAGGVIISAVAAAMPYILLAAGVFLAVKTVIGAAQSILSFVGNFFTGVGNFISGVFGGGGIPLVKSGTAQLASGTSIRFNNWLKGNTQGAAQAANSAGNITGAIIQNTTLASMSSSLIAAGLLFPIVLTAMLTMIVWAVITNSFNDSPNGGIVQTSTLSRDYCAEDNPSLVSTAKGIVSDLQPGWWKYYNRHPAYPELFNTVLFNAYPRKSGTSANGYTEPDYYIVQAQSSSIQRDLFWCTWLIVKTYQLNNLPIGEHIYVPTMLARWSAGPVVKNKSGIPGGGNIQDDPISARSIPLGAAVFFGKPDTFNAGNSGAGRAHVAMVCDIQFDDAAQTSGTLTTCDSNNYRTLNTFNIINGQVQDSDSLTVDYFGLPGDTAPTCGPSSVGPVEDDGTQINQDIAPL